MKKKEQNSGSPLTSVEQGLVDVLSHVISVEHKLEKAITDIVVPPTKKPKSPSARTSSTQVKPTGSAKKTKAPAKSKSKPGEKQPAKRTPAKASKTSKPSKTPKTSDSKQSVRRPSKPKV